MRSVLLWLALSTAALARPVSFVGSTMVMSTAQPMMVGLTVDHTPFRRLSFGLGYQWLAQRTGDLHFLAPQTSLLLLRHNALEWQGNIFFTAAVGGIQHMAHIEAAGLAAIEADAESRRLYVLGSARYLRGLQGRQDFQAMGRVGWAPVVAEVEQLNPWIVLQYQYMPSFTNRHVFTPMVRLLYQGFLLEVGSSLRGEWTVNFSAEL